MCSINADGGEEMVQQLDNIQISDICRKCASEGSKIVLRKSDVYCNSCFLTYFVHKFRSTIGKSRQIKPNDKILIGFSGGPNSSALLHLIRQGLDEISHKKLRFNPAFIYINEDAIDGKHSTDICSAVTDLNFPCYQINFSEIFSADKLSITEYTKDEGDRNTKSDYDKQLTNFLNETFSSTSKEDAIDQLRNELICRSASALGYHKVFLANNCTNLSVRILADVALGRGSQLSGHVHFKATVFNVDIYRPMRELLENEVNHYLEIANINVAIHSGKIPTSCNKHDFKRGIVACTRNFLTDLQKEFPSTIPTVFKTGDKLISPNFHSGDSSTVASMRTSLSEEDPSSPDDKIETKNVSNDVSLCVFCGFVIDTNVSSSSALEAVNISRFMSSLQPPGSIFQRLQQADETTSPAVKGHNIQSSLCYGCSNLVREMNTIEILPSRVKSDFERRKEMRDQIQDCLL